MKGSFGRTRINLMRPFKSFRHAPHPFSFNNGLYIFSVGSFLIILVTYFTFRDRTGRKSKLVISDKPEDLYASCIQSNIENLRSFDANINDENRHFALHESLSIKQEAPWDFINENRIFPTSFDAMVHIPTFGNMLGLDISAINKLASKVRSSNRRTRRFHYSTERQVDTLYLHRHLDRSHGLQYVLNFKPFPTSAKKNSSFTLHLQQLVGEGPCKVSVYAHEEVDRPMFIVLPYSAREDRLRYFIKWFIHLRKHKNLNLVLIVSVLRKSADAKFVYTVMQEFFPTTSTDISRSIWLSENEGDSKGRFSRSVALREASNMVKQDDSTIFFCDVDIVIHPDFVHRCQENAIYGSQAYFPVFYNLFSYANDNPVVKTQQGFWRVHSYGMACIKKGDFVSLNVFEDAESRFNGWGPEDRFFYEKVRNSSSLAAFRSLDPSLVHRWHNKNCDLNSESYQSCLNSNAMAIGHPLRLGEALESILPGVGIETLEKYIRSS